MNTTIDEAVSALRRGEAVVFPTDTVYGVGVCPYAAHDLQLLYDLKRRERDKPVAWLVSSCEDLARYGRSVPSYAETLAQALWPGALTLIVDAAGEVPCAFRSSDGTLGMRMPASATALSLLRALGKPIATTSANFSGERPPRAFDDLDPDFASQVVCVLSDTADEDASCYASGIASTVLDCTGAQCRLVREGAVSFDDICALID